MKKYLKQLLNKRLKNEKGLTLIELLAVIVILAIVAAIAIPAIGNIINNSRDRAILAEASNLLSAAKIAVTDGACQGDAGTDLTCDATELDPFYDGDVTDVSVSWTDEDGNREYTVTYPDLANIKDTTKFGNFSDKTITEDELLKALEK